MTILYINNEHCTSLEQLRGYFNLTLHSQDDIYLDLIDNGRDHIISKWLQEIGSSDLAIQLDNIDFNLCDSEYFIKMSAIILEREDTRTFIKAKFSQCFILDSVDQKDDGQGKGISVKLKVLLPVNESYELRVQTSWGTKAINVNPFNVAKGDYITEILHFRKRPSKEFEVDGIFADGEELSCNLVNANIQSATSDDDFVDLGLSVKWSKCNLGANSPEEYGNYYAWGETEPKEEYISKNSRTYGMKISCIGGNPQYDVATAALGEGVRLPTKREIEELADQCTTTWTIQNEVYGRLVTGPNRNSIFLPAAGYREDKSLVAAGDYGGYWASVPINGNFSNAYSLYIGSGCFDLGNWSRYFGHSIRPVREK